MGFYFNEDNRIHINLSEYAWKIINDDILNFYNDPNLHISTILNDIIENYYSLAECSIQPRWEESSKKIFDFIDKFNINIAEDDIFDIIDEVQTEQLDNITKTTNKYPNDRYCKLKLRKDFANYLREESKEDETYKNQIGNYLKCLIEEFTRLPFVTRERILFTDIIKTIQDAIHYEQQLSVTVKSGKKYNVIPYKIKTNKLGFYNYLVAINTDDNTPAAFRISHCNFKLKTTKGKISTKQKEIIKNKMLNTDLMFLSNENVKIIVKFNEYGIKNYINQLFMRPSIKKDLGNNTYEFECPIDQARFYFTKFGSSAKIIEPVYLAKKLKHFYNYALNAYDDIDD